MRNVLPWFVAASLAANLVAIAPAAAKSAPQGASIAAALAAPDRPQADKDRDAARKPDALIAFAGIKAGDRVADIMPGQGYFTRIFSKIAGPSGKVFAVVPSELLEKFPKAADGTKAIAAEPGFANVSVAVPSATTLSLPEPLDVAWTSDNYHDVYGFFGADSAAAFDAAVFKALKPGGVFIVIDHNAAAGSADTAPTKLHRIDAATVKAQVLAAGFVLESESALLANPADTHDKPVFAPELRGHTDQFVLKFRKPAR